MSNLTIDVNTSTLRQTDDHKYSIYDFISLVSGVKNPRDTWKSLIERYPDTVAKTDSVKLNRIDGKKANIATPVADKQTLLEILAVLPGKLGAKYRAEAAKLVLRYIGADPKLADDVIQRMEDPKELAWLDSRIKGKVIRFTLTDAISRTNPSNQFVYSHCTNTIYKSLFGKTAKQMKDESRIVRDGLTTKELTNLSFTEQLAADKINKKLEVGQSVKPFDVCKEAGIAASKFINDFMNT